MQEDAGRLLLVLMLLTPVVILLTAAIAYLTYRSKAKTFSALIWAAGWLVLTSMHTLEGYPTYTFLQSVSVAALSSAGAIGIAALYIPWRDEPRLNGEYIARSILGLAIPPFVIPFMMVVFLVIFGINSF